MEKLFETFLRKLAAVNTEFVRSIDSRIEWDARLIGLRGARGVGKTTLLLQHIKQNNALDGSVLYVSLDNIWFSEHKLYDLADNFYKHGGKTLYLDEIHRYPDWSRKLKNIYDDFPELHIVFTGSSLLERLNARADLSRRAVVYDMQGLSFREYLSISRHVCLPVTSLDDILEKHVQIAMDMVSSVRPLQFFGEYLRSGYYPYYQEQPLLYYSRINEVVNLIIDIEMPQLRSVDIANVNKVKKLLFAVAESAPFTPNINKLSERIGISRVSLLQYLKALEDSGLTINMAKDAKGINRLQKPDKLYLENTNLMYAIAPGVPNIGSVRETFFANQLKDSHNVCVSRQSDFLVDGKHTFEIGGHSKGYQQIDGLPDAYVVADDIETGIGNKIPLWLFGFLY